MHRNWFLGICQHFFVDGEIWLLLLFRESVCSAKNFYTLLLTLSLYPVFFFSGRPIYGNGDEKIKLSLHCLRSRAHRNHQTFPIKSSNNNISTVNFLDVWRDILWIHFNCLSLLPLFIFRFDNMKMHSPKTSRKQTHTQKLTVPRYSSDIFRHMCVWIFYCVKKFLE